MLGYKSSNSYWGGKTKQQEKQSGAQSTKEGAERLGRFSGALRGGKDTDMVSRIQAYGKAEGERQKKKKQEEEEAAKKKAAEKSTAPQKGFLQRMMDKYWHKKEN